MGSADIPMPLCLNTLVLWSPPPIVAPGFGVPGDAAIAFGSLCSKSWKLRIDLITDTKLHNNNKAVL